jgi:hypothetical protein
MQMRFSYLCSSLSISGLKSWCRPQAGLNSPQSGRFYLVSRLRKRPSLILRPKTRFGNSRLQDLEKAKKEFWEWRIILASSFDEVTAVHT